MLMGTPTPDPGANPARPEHAPAGPARSKDDAEPDRKDLAAMIVPLGRTLMAAELPVLRRHGLTMWG